MFTTLDYVPERHKKTLKKINTVHDIKRSIRNSLVCVQACACACMHAHMSVLTCWVSPRSIQKQHRKQSGASLGRTCASHSALSLAAFPLARLMWLLQLLLDSYRQLMETFRVVINGVRIKSQILGFHSTRSSITLDIVFPITRVNKTLWFCCSLLSLLHSCLHFHFFKLWVQWKC